MVTTDYIYNSMHKLIDIFFGENEAWLINRNLKREQTVAKLLRSGDYINKWKPIQGQWY